MNKIKQELRQKLQGQLSDEKTELDVDNAYSVVKENSVLLVFFAPKTVTIKVMVGGIEVGKMKH